MNLFRRTFSAVRWNTVSTVARAGLQVAQIAVLARFLSPQDYGLMAMVAVVLSYAGLFSDMGLSTAFVQRQQISHEERSSLYWLSVVVGGVLMLLVMAASPLAAQFFKEPQLVPLMMLAATNFLVIALGQQLRMDAEKALNFRPVALVEITAAIVGFVVAVLTAWWGWGVFALVTAAMVSAWMNMLLAWVLLANGWRPAWRLRWDEVRWFARFGGGLVINNVINHVNATIDLLIGGRMLGASLLGFYSVPRNLILQIQGMVNPVITRVGFPLIASIQDDKEKVKQVYLKTMNATASINAPIYVAVAVFAPEIVLLLLGQKWSDSIPLLRVLAIWGLLRSFGSPVGVLLLGLGRVSLSVKWNASLFLIVPPVVWIGSQWGAIGMAWAMAGFMAIGFVPAWVILVQPTCGAGLWEYAKAVLMPTFCAGAAGVAGWMAAELMNAAVIRLVIGLSVGFITYIGLSLIFNKNMFMDLVDRLNINLPSKLYA